MENIIHYGFGVDYLPNWGIQQALREIYQNFLDFGEYSENIFLGDNEGETTVSISNTWEPASLDFLRIGNSQKGRGIAIGKHGEGLKMAFLILQREGFRSWICTPKYMVTPSLYADKEIGECFCLEYTELQGSGFRVNFTCKTEDFLEFKENLITKEDIIYTDRIWGSIVNKPVGRIYSGGLFVAEFNNMSHAYDIRPDRLPLDRDRSVPGAFDVTYATSNINGSYGKFRAKDLGNNDTTYLDTVPEEAIEEFTPVAVGNDITFTYKGEDGQDKVVANESVKQALKKHSFFDKAIKKLKHALTSQMGLEDLMIEFKRKHVHGTEATNDFNLIMEKAGIEVDTSNDLPF